MATDPTDWYQALARVTGVLVRGEQRVTTHELLTVYLGIPVTDRASRRLRRVMRELGWRGPRRMRWGERTLNGYWRHPTVRLLATLDRNLPIGMLTEDVFIQKSFADYFWLRRVRGPRDWYGSYTWLQKDAYKTVRDRCDLCIL
jgi:hypothetical protein